MKPRHSLAVLMQLNKDLQKHKDRVDASCQSLDQAQKEWVDKRINEINASIRKSNTYKASNAHSPTP